MKVVYGHTDSIYCTVDSISDAQDACTKINDGVQELFPNVFDWEEHPVQLEFEKFFEVQLRDSRRENADPTRRRRENRHDLEKSVL